MEGNAWPPTMGCHVGDHVHDHVRDHVRDDVGDHVGDQHFCGPGPARTFLFTHHAFLALFKRTFLSSLPSEMEM